MLRLVFMTVQTNSLDVVKKLWMHPSQCKGSSYLMYINETDNLKLRFIPKNIHHVNLIF